MQTNNSGWLFIIPILGVLLAQVVIIWKWYAELRAKAKEDKRTAKLTRLNQQLSDLYGPLYALYETGEQNWFDFINGYSNDPMKELEFKRFFPEEERYFVPPNETQLKEYRLRMKTIFMPTNIAMEQVITNNAALLLGKEMPECLLRLCVHVASNKPVMEKWDNEEVDKTNWQNHKAGFPHPGFAVREYIRASFDILKEEQKKILNREQDDVDEGDLEKQINDQIKLLKSAREKRYKIAQEALSGKNTTLETNVKIENPMNVNQHKPYIYK